jgi:branched-chain amino acid transport system permease protein
MRCCRLAWLFVALAVLVGVAAPGALAEEDDADAGGTGESIRGILRDPDGQGIADVVIVVEQDGAAIGEATTDEDGAWSVEVPGAGTYQVTLAIDTLPEGIALRDPDRATLAGVRLTPGQSRAVIFPLGEGAGGGVARFERIVNLAADGIRLGLILALASIGLSLIFGVTGLVNFAHGELVTFGALAAFFFSASGAFPEQSLFLATAIAVLLGSALGLGLERGLFRPLRRRRSGNVSLIVVTIGLSLVMRHLYLIIFDGRPRPFDEFTIQRGASLGPLSLRPKDWIIIGLASLIILLVGLMLQKTRLGTAMRAVSDNPPLAASSGIDVDRVIAATWILGGGLAALGGVFQGVSETVLWDMGFTLLLLMFAAVILGGIGSAYGAVVGALVIGVASQVSTYWISPKFRTGVGLAVLIVVILLRPQGILGRAERVG